MIHQESLERIKSGPLSVLVPSLESLVDTLESTGATIASMTIGFEKDDDVVKEGDCVPEIIIKLRKFPFSND